MRNWGARHLEVVLAWNSMINKGWFPGLPSVIRFPLIIIILYLMGAGGGVALIYGLYLALAIPIWLVLGVDLL